MSDTKKRTELHELGRYRLLERLSEGLDPCNRTTAMGLGHDASAMAPTKRRVVMASGLMLEGIHFNLTYFPLKHLGYKSLIAQLGRIYAMNAEPQQAQGAALTDIILAERRGGKGNVALVHAEHERQPPQRHRLSGGKEDGFYRAL